MHSTHVDNNLSTFKLTVQCNFNFLSVNNRTRCVIYWDPFTVVLDMEFQDFILELDGLCEAGIIKKEKLVHGSFYEDTFAVMYSKIVRFKFLSHKRHTILQASRTAVADFIEEYQGTINEATQDIQRLLEKCHLKPIVVLVDYQLSLPSVAAHPLVLVLRRDEGGNLDAILKDCVSIDKSVIPVCVFELLTNLAVDEVKLVGHLNPAHDHTNNSAVEALRVSKGILTGSNVFWYFNTKAYSLRYNTTSRRRL